MERKKIIKICITSVLTGLAIALSYFKIPIGLSFGGFGGSINCVMIPIIICGYYFGIHYGLMSGLIVGIIKFLIGNSFTISWASILLDYLLAYMSVGVSGMINKNGKIKLWLSALVGCTAKFLIHFISGITIYKEYVSDIFGLKMTNAWIYSLLYNGSFMLPNSIIAIVICLIIERPVSKLFSKIM